MTMQPIPFIDLAAQRQRLGKTVDEAISRILDHGGYIMGPEVGQLESALARFCGARHVISCANGTDALTLVLMATGVGQGDAVFCPSFTFVATAEAAAALGATPVFVDVLKDTFNLDPSKLESAIVEAEGRGLKPRVIIPVDLFGQPADYDAILPIADRHGMFVLSDAAQSFGAEYHGRKVGVFGLATTTSFFPAKPLGCYGDGGAIFTDDDELAATLRSLRVHGQGSDKYDNVRIGMNARLDTVQAAVLLQKLKIFPDELARRQEVADRYAQGLGNVVAVPHLAEGRTSSWAQYTIRVAPEQRQTMASALKAKGIPTAVYYPKPLHRQQAYSAFSTNSADLGISDQLADEVISLPMHPYLSEDVQAYICDAVRNAA